MSPAMARHSPPAAVTRAAVAVHRLLGEVDDRDLRAGFREGYGHGRADGAATARDEGDAVIESEPVKMAHRASSLETVRIVGWSGLSGVAAAVIIDYRASDARCARTRWRVKSSNRCANQCSPMVGCLPVSRSTRVARPDPLAAFEAATRDWFRGSFEAPRRRRRRAGRPSRQGSTPSSVRPRAAARRWQPSSGAWTVCSPRTARRPACGHCACCTCRRSRHSSTTSIATCGHRWQVSRWQRSGSASRRARCGWACARETPRPMSGAPSASGPRTSSSRRRNRSTSS